MLVTPCFIYKRLDCLKQCTKWVTKTAHTRSWRLHGKRIARFRAIGKILWKPERSFSDIFTDSPYKPGTKSPVDHIGRGKKIAKVAKVFLFGQSKRLIRHFFTIHLGHLGETSLSFRHATLLQKPSHRLWSNA